MSLVSPPLTPPPCLDIPPPLFDLLPPALPRPSSLLPVDPSSLVFDPSLHHVPLPYILQSLHRAAPHLLKSSLHTQVASPLSLHPSTLSLPVRFLSPSPPSSPSSSPSQSPSQSPSHPIPPPTHILAIHIPDRPPVCLPIHSLVYSLAANSLSHLSLYSAPPPKPCGLCHNCLTRAEQQQHSQSQSSSHCNSNTPPCLSPLLPLVPINLNLPDFPISALHIIHTYIYLRDPNILYRSLRPYTAAWIEQSVRTVMSVWQLALGLELGDSDFWTVLADVWLEIRSLAAVLKSHS